MLVMGDYRENEAAPGEARHPALALVNSQHNSAAGPIDELASTASLGVWLRAHGLAGVRGCRADDLPAFRTLRDAIRVLLLARIDGRVPDRSAIAVINEAAAAAPSAAGLKWSASGPFRAVNRAGATGPALARALIAADAIDLVVGEHHTELRACAAPGCVRLLLRDHPRRAWCSTRCGDRVRASRYYHRHRPPR